MNAKTEFAVIDRAVEHVQSEIHIKSAICSPRCVHVTVDYPSIVCMMKPSTLVISQYPWKEDLIKFYIFEAIAMLTRIFEV